MTTNMLDVCIRGTNIYRAQFHMLNMGDDLILYVDIVPCRVYIENKYTLSF